MKNIVYCKSCKKEIVVGKNYTDRYALSKKLGKEFEITCPHCKNINKYNINKVYAKSNVVNYLIFLLITFLLTILIGYYVLNLTDSSLYLYYLLPSALLVPWLIFFVYEKEQRKKIRNFNKHKY